MKYTRKIQKEYNQILFKNVEIDYEKDVNGEYLKDEEGNKVPRVTPNLNDSREADEHLVKAMTGISQEDIDNMKPEEFDIKLKECKDFAGLSENGEKGKEKN